MSINFEENKVKANYSPIYAGIYPELALLFREHGYALAVHGSMRRDFDVIAIPWTDTPDSPAVIFEHIKNEFGWNLVGDVEYKEHGRFAYQVKISWGDCYIDLSFMPVRQVDMSIDQAKSLIAEAPDFAASALIAAIADAEYFQKELISVRGY